MTTNELKKIAEVAKKLLSRAKLISIEKDGMVNAGIEAVLDLKGRTYTVKVTPFQSVWDSGFYVFMKAGEGEVIFAGDMGYSIGKELFDTAKELFDTVREKEKMERELAEKRAESKKEKLLNDLINELN